MSYFHRMKLLTYSLIGTLVLNALAAPFSFADVGPTVTITSPSTGTTQTGVVTINAVAKPDPAGTADGVINIGLKIKGLSTDVAFLKTPFVLNRDGQNPDSSLYSISFGDLGTTFPAWNYEPGTFKQPISGKFSISFDTTDWPNQTYEVTLFAKDSNQRSSASQTIQFTTQALAPTVTITSPSTGTTQTGVVTINLSLIHI